MARRNACGFIETPTPTKVLLPFDWAKPELNLVEGLSRHSLS